MSTLPPAGWYPDPSGDRGGLRYWDGARWTEHVQGVRGPQRQRTAGTEVPTTGWDPGVSPVGASALPDPIPQTGRPWPTYWADVRWSAGALVASPWLVIVSLVPYVLLELRVRDVRPLLLWALLAIAAEVFVVGFAGTQRVWFLRRARAVGIDATEVWNLSWRFFGRFLCLGLLWLIPIVIVSVPIVIVTTHRVVSSTGVVTTTTSNSWALRSVLVALSFVIDVVLTFVVPALALTTRSVRASFRLAWLVTKRSWPTNVWYLFAPGITLLALSGALPRSVVPTGGAILLSFFAALLALLFKGATTAFYIRTVPPVGVDGAT